MIRLPSAVPVYAGQHMEGDLTSQRRVRGMPVGLLSELDDTWVGHPFGGVPKFQADDGTGGVVVQD
jgi:hypothetical protein